MVRVAGIEPARRLQAADFKSAVATDYTTLACLIETGESNSASQYLSLRDTRDHTPQIRYMETHYSSACAI